MAQQYFGGNFDFVRKITEENGTIIYMYGYGQTVLIVNTDGSIEYKEEQTENTPGQSLSDALETALQFVADHGSWESMGKAELTPYLEDVVRDPNKEKGYRFIFGLEVNGTRIYYENGAPVIVDVTSGQVTYYKRQFIDFDQKEIDSTKNDPKDDAFSVANLIAQNFKYIYDTLLQFGEVPATADQAAMFEDIASLVKDIRIGYMKPANDKSTEILPVWVVTVKDTNVYFDLYSADPVGYSKE
jgi:regulatory protein YycH of two-component signal transduction system YycFG